MSSETRKQIEYSKKEARDPRSRQARSLLKYLSYMKFWLAVAVLSAFPLTVSAQTWRWIFEDVDVQGAGTSIAVDGDGNLHLAYYVSMGGELRYGFRPAGTSKWYKMALASGLNSMDTGITLDANGNPQICYTPSSIRYARWDGKRWSTQEIDPGSPRIGFTCSIRVSPEGRPMVVWYEEGGPYLRFAVLKDGVWLASSVDGGGGEWPGKWNSMVLDARGQPHISYSDWPAPELKYAQFNGQNWAINVVDAPDPKKSGEVERSMGNSLVLDAKGSPLISYYDEESLRLARLVDGRWKSEVVESLPPYGRNWSWKNFRSTLVLDSKGRPHIGFESRLGLEHAWWDGEKWQTQLLVSTMGFPLLENAMAIDRNDDLYVPFRDPRDGTLRLAVGRPEAATESAKEGQKQDGGRASRDRASTNE